MGFGRRNQRTHCRIGYRRTVIDWHPFNSQAQRQDCNALHSSPYLIYKRGAPACVLGLANSIFKLDAGVN